MAVGLNCRLLLTLVLCHLDLNAVSWDLKCIDDIQWSSQLQVFQLQFLNVWDSSRCIDQC